MQNSGSHSEDWVAIGRLSHTQGNHGELFGEILTDFPGRFDGLTAISILRPNNRVEDYPIESLWTHKDGIVFKFLGVDSISEAEKFVGGLLVVNRENLTPLTEGQFYHFDLVGSDALNEAGEGIGKIVRIDDFNGNQLLAVEKNDSREFWVPFSKDFILHVDCRLKQVILRIPEELESLNP